MNVSTLLVNKLWTYIKFPQFFLLIFFSVLGSNSGSHFAFNYHISLISTYLSFSLLFKTWTVFKSVECPFIFICLMLPHD